MNRDITATGSAPWAGTSTARPPLLLTLCLLATVVALLPRPTNLRLWAGLGACAAAALAGTWWAIATHRPSLSVAFLDVGQGLSAAVILPGGAPLLYDAGPRWREYDAGERVVVPALRRLGVTHVDTLAISHRHPDHSGGVEAVCRDLGISRIWEAYGAQAPARGREIVFPGGARIQMLSPPAAPVDEPSPSVDENDRSLALLVSFGDTGVVLTGDAGPAVATVLTAADTKLPAHLVLQAPHHGGSPEACRILAAALRPETSVVSVGRNTYGHPRPGAIAALEAFGRVLRTDRDGAVLIHGNGSRIEVRSWREMTTGRTWAERVRWLAAGW
jgi:competence protein ComEC